MMILGKGPSAAIAKEGALKIKEVTYIHAEAFVAGEMKHGPIALINCDEPGSTKVLLMIFDDEYFNDMHLALSEVKSRQAHTIVITDCPDKID
jgi:glucosamine--fructose-6-phosphate aminotransferase (isomerizing)